MSCICRKTNTLGYFVLLCIECQLAFSVGWACMENKNSPWNGAWIHQSMSCATSYVHRVEVGDLHTQEEDSV